MAQTPTFRDLLAAVPAPGQGPDIECLEALLPAEISAMAACPQDPRHHGEEDVWTHVQMVLEALCADPEFQALEEIERSALFWAGALHDIAKPQTTRTEPDGSITAPGHSRAGASRARYFLWRSEAPFAWREQIAQIIAVHQHPFWLIERPAPERAAALLSWEVRPRLLLLHAAADARGRVCEDQVDLLDRVALARVLFEESGCVDQPYAFANNESRLQAFLKDDRAIDYPAHESFSGDMTLLAGLPGSGKDSWIRQNGDGRPVIGLDELRETMGVSATDNQGQVIQAAREAARTHLRAGTPFIWNGTNTTRQMRGALLGLARDYGAHTRIIYIEPDRSTLLRQNRDRDAQVPEAVIDKLARKLEPPMPSEAHEVIRITGH